MYVKPISTLFHLLSLYSFLPAIWKGTGAAPPHPFNKMQLDLLEKIKTYMLHESILNTETFEAPVFKMEGGFARFNKKFGGNLIEIIREINTYIYEGAA